METQNKGVIMSNQDLDRMYEEEVADFEKNLELVWDMAEVMGLTLPLEKNSDLPYFGMAIEVVKDLMPQDLFKGSNSLYLNTIKDKFSSWGQVIGWYVEETHYLIVGFNESYNLGLVVDDTNTTLKIAPLGNFDSSSISYNLEVIGRYEKRLKDFQQLNKSLVKEGSHTYLNSFDNNCYTGLYVRNVDRLKGNNFSQF